MGEILHNFGFDLKLFIAQIINFLILAYILKRFLYKPILSVLKEREKKIAKGLEDAKNAQLALDEAEKKKNEILKETQTQAEKILELAKTQSRQIKDETLQTTKEEAENIINQARTQAQLEFKKMQDQARNLSLDISHSVLQRLIKSLFTKEEQSKILGRALAQLKKN